MEQQQHFGSNVNTAGLVYLREGATMGDTTSPGTPPLSRQQSVTNPSIAAAASAASLLLRQHGGGAAAAAVAVSHAMPVDYSMYNLWQQQQQNQHHLTGLSQHSHLLNSSNNNGTSNSSSVISTIASTSSNSTITNNNANLVATASSSMLSINTHHQHNHHQHHHQHQSSHHNNHQQLQINNNPHHHHHQQQLHLHQASERDTASFVSGLDLRDHRLATLGGMLGDVGSKIGTLDGGSGKLTTPGMDFCNKLNVPSVASLLPGDLGARIGTTLGDLSSRLSATIGSSGDFGARMGAIVAADNSDNNGGSAGANDTNNASSGSGSNNTNNTISSPIEGDTGPPDYSRALSLTSCSDSLMARQSIVSACSNSLGGINRTNAGNNAAQERLFYNDFFNTAKKASPGGLGGSGASDMLSPGSNFAHDMSINMVNSLIRQGVCGSDQTHFSPSTTNQSGLQHMGELDGGVSIPKQEIVADAFPLTSSSAPMDLVAQQHHYPGLHQHDPSKGGVDGRNVNGLFMYGGGEEYGATYGSKLTGHHDAQEAHQRLKLDPYSNPATTLPDNIINTGQHFMQNNSVNNTNSPSNNNNNNGDNNDVSLPSMNSEIINDQEVFSCTHCLYKTPRKNYLKQHLRTHTGEGKVFCPICPYSTVWRQRLKHHVINHQKEKKQRTFPSRSRSVPNDSNNTDSLLNSSNSSHHPHHNNNNNRLSQNGVVTGNSNVLHSSNINYIGDVSGGVASGDGDDRKRFKCEYCPYSTGNKNYLKQHTRTHTGDGTISCPECNYKSVWRQRMKRHIMSHRGEKEASCTHCSYSTFDKEKLAKHIEAHGDEVYTCTICNFTTQRKTYMKQHTRTHTGEGKVQCPHCPYQTVWKQRLKLHVKKHMSEPGGSSIPRNVARLHCPHCDFKSCRKDRLRNHMRIHNAELFRCDLCPYTSASSDLLQHHAETHTNEAGDSSAGGNSSSLFGIADQRSLDGVPQDVKNIGLLAAAAAARGGLENEADDYSGDVGDMIDVKHVPLRDFEGYDSGYHIGLEGSGRMEAERESLIQRINEMTESARGSPSSCGSPVAGTATTHQDNLRMSLFKANREGLQEFITTSSSAGHEPSAGPESKKKKKRRKTGEGDNDNAEYSGEPYSDSENGDGFERQRSSVLVNGEPSSSVNYSQNEPRRPDYCHSDTVTNPNYCQVACGTNRAEHSDSNRFPGTINSHHSSIANSPSSINDQIQAQHSGHEDKFPKPIPGVQTTDHRQYPVNGSEMSHLHRQPLHHHVGFPTPPPAYGDPNGEHSMLLQHTQHIHGSKKSVVESQFNDVPCVDDAAGIAACNSSSTTNSTAECLSYRGSNNERGDSYGGAATAMSNNGPYGSGGSSAASGMTTVISGFSPEIGKKGTVN